MDETQESASGQPASHVPVRPANASVRSNPAKRMPNAAPPPAGDEPFTFEDHGAYSVIKLFPTLNERWTEVEAHAQELGERVDASRAQRVLLDLSPLEHCGSAVIALMVHVWKVLKRRDGSMAICCPSDLMLEILATARLTELWSVYRTRAAADRAVRRSPRARYHMATIGLAGLGLLNALIVAVSVRVDPRIAPADLPGGLRVAGIGATQTVLLCVSALLFFTLAAMVRTGDRIATIMAAFWTVASYVLLAVGLGFGMGRGWLPSGSIVTMGTAAAGLFVAIAYWLVLNGLDAIIHGDAEIGSGASGDATATPQTHAYAARALTWAGGFALTAAAIPYGALDRSGPHEIAFVVLACGLFVGAVGVQLKRYPAVLASKLWILVALALIAFAVAYDIGLARALLGVRQGTAAGGAQFIAVAFLVEALLWAGIRLGGVRAAMKQEQDA